MKFSDFSKLIKLRLTLTVVISASISFLVGSRLNGIIIWANWFILIVGGFLVTSAANCFNEIIEKDYDKLMRRTMDRPIPAGRMTTGQALVLGLFMAMAGTYLLGKLNLTAGYLSVFSIVFYAFIYTPLKRVSPIAVFAGAIPGALPPLIGYVAAHEKIDSIALILFGIQFIWQFPHFWAIAWVLDDDYKLAGFRLLPSGKRNAVSAAVTVVFAILLVPVSLLPTFYHYGGYVVGIVSLICGVYFLYLSAMLLRTLSIDSAKRLMYGSFIYLPLVQLMFLFDFIGKGR